MSAADWPPLRDEGGQALVFVILSLGVLVAAVALVVDVGSWFQAQRHAQSAADAAALAAAPQLLDNPAAIPGIADSVAHTNWPNAQVPVPTPGPRDVTVTVEPPAGANLSPFGHFPISISASATARIQVPSEVNAVAPIAVVCSQCRFGQTPGWSANTWSDGSPVYVSYTPGSPDTNSFSPVQLPGVSNRSDFRDFVTCDASAPRSSDCNPTSSTAPEDRQRLCLRTVTMGPPQNRRTSCRDANRLESYLSPAVDPTGNELHLIAISSGYSGGSYRIVGWAAAAFTGLSQSGNNNNGTVQLTLSFHSLLVDGKWFDETSPAGNDNFDFGVRAIALTG